MGNGDDVGNFEVDPAAVRLSADSIKGQVATDFDQKAALIRADSHIGSPGFGLALSWAEALYLQRVDFMAKDVSGAGDLCRQIGERLRTTADQFDHAENLNLAGFSGTSNPERGFGDAYGSTGIVQTVTDPATLSTMATLSMTEILGALAAMSVCGAMCPTFLPAVAVGVPFVANLISIAEAGGKLSHHGDSLTKSQNTIFEDNCKKAAESWKGMGAQAYSDLITKIKAHLDELAGSISALGQALESLVAALTGLWIGLITLTLPFLVWLTAMWVMSAFPPFAPAAQSIVNAMGVVMTTAVTSIAAAASIALGLVVGVINALTKDFLGQLALPDEGAQGTPDLTEFKVGANFAT